MPERVDWYDPVESWLEFHRTLDDHLHCILTLSQTCIYPQMIQNIPLLITMTALIKF